MNRHIVSAMIGIFFLTAFPAVTFASATCSSNADNGKLLCYCDVSGTELPASSSSTFTSDSCTTECTSLSATSWTLKQCLGTDASRNSLFTNIGQGNVTSATADAPTTTDASFLVPNLNVAIPGFEKFSTPTKSESGTYTNVNFIAEYINAIYGWVIAAGALIAIVMMMLGGLQYVLSRGKSKYIDKAKARITNAVTGLVLLLAAYNIAFLIDPRTTVLSNLQILTVHELPLENMVEFGEGVDPDPNGNFYGQSKWQDCMLTALGKTKSEVKLKSVTYNGKSYEANEAIATDLQAVFDDISAANLSYQITSIGTYNWRASANNPNALSFHSWGVAIDINPSTNPNCQKNSTDPKCTKVPPNDIPREIIDIFKSHNFGWGGEWKSLKDYMHFSTTKFCGGSR